MCDCRQNRGHVLSRRSLVLGGATLLTLTCGGRPLRALPLPAEARSAPNDIGGDEALARLMAGNARYQADLPGPTCLSACRAAIATRQYPIAAMVCCSDSRVAPELVFDQDGGQIFVVRVAGNIVDTDGIASLEYAVRELNVPLLLVVGHARCGAVTAAVNVVRDKIEVPGHLTSLVNQIRPAVDAAAPLGGDLLANAIILNARTSARKIADSAPILAPAIAGGRVKLATAIYDLASGAVTLV
ncbi:carbonic anhydrase [Aquabacter spiritensis]|uniref:Carbonic anhydrase n=1 Tax=Aquabacter spiritensis TaxID=933073 RepID=A0A4V6NZF3_9HYPH|nr:carbonic anhydrase [Aquabacter spiritensis]TCT00978.1 carbonic anhydrase [Aquabacter spiritensis]